MEREYTVSPPLPPGVYDVQIESSGFKTAKLSAVDVGVGGVATLDVKMEVGGIEESVSVTAAAPLIETTRSQTSTLVDDRAAAELPINGRNFLDFTLLTPGVSRDLTHSAISASAGSAERQTASSWMVPIPTMCFWVVHGRSGGGRNPYSFSQDAVQEFQVSSNGYAAEVGRASGGVINVITKSGTNDFHGTVFDFPRQVDECEYLTTIVMAGGKGRITSTNSVETLAVRSSRTKRFSFSTTMASATRRQTP